MTPGKNGDHETWGAIAYSAAYYRIHCDEAYKKPLPQLGRSIVYLRDGTNDDDFIVGCPGWDTTTYPDVNDLGGIYMIAD